VCLEVHETHSCYVAVCHSLLEFVYDLHVQGVSVCGAQELQAPFYYMASHLQNSEIEEFETMVLCRSSGEQDSLTLDGLSAGWALCETESLLLSFYE